MTGGFAEDRYPSDGMLDFVTIAFRLTLGSVGILLIYASLSYEDEEGRIQSLLEQWWIRINDSRRQAISLHIAFMRVLASLTTAALDRLFGLRVLSVQAIGVSMCYSMVSFGIASLILTRLNATSNDPLPLNVVLLVFGAVYGTIPAIQADVTKRVLSIKYVDLWFGGLCFFFWSYFSNMFGSPLFFYLTTSDGKKAASTGGLFFVCIVFAMLLFTIFVGIMRLTMRTIARSESPIKIVGLSLLNAMPILFFYCLIEVKVWWESSSLSPGASLLISYFKIYGRLLNFATLFPAVLFVCLGGVMLLHRLFWPAIERPIYRLQAIGVAKRPAVFRTIGCLLLGAAFGKHEWLRSILETL